MPAEVHRYLYIPVGTYICTRALGLLLTTGCHIECVRTVGGKVLVVGGRASWSTTSFHIHPITCRRPTIPQAIVNPQHKHIVTIHVTVPTDAFINSHSTLHFNNRSAILQNQHQLIQSPMLNNMLIHHIIAHITRITVNYLSPHGQKVHIPTSSRSYEDSAILSWEKDAPKRFSFK